MFETSRRRLLGASMIGAGAVLNTFGYRASVADLTQKGNVMLDKMDYLPDGLREATQFPLI